MLARLLPLWNYSFLKFLISFTNNDLYSLPHMTSRILVNNGMSKSLWFVISMDGQRVSRRFLNQHVLDCSGSILLCNCTLSVKRFSLSKSTSQHSCLPPLSIGIKTSTQFLYSWIKLSFPEAILHAESLHLINCWKN